MTAVHSYLAYTEVQLDALAFFLSFWLFLSGHFVHFCHRLFVDAYFITCESRSLINADLWSAELVSPVVSPTSFGAHCLSFAFFVHCGSADNLTVFTRSSGGTMLKIWSKSCERTSEWEHANIQLASYKTPFQVNHTAHCRVLHFFV